MCKMSKKEILLALIDYYSGGNQTNFAKKIDVKPQTISSWISRDSFDIEKIYSKCVEISANWLLTGEGDMLKSEHVAAAPAAGSAASTPPMSDDIRKLYDVIDRLTQEIWLQRKEITEIRQQNNRLLDLLDVKKSR